MAGEPRSPSPADEIALAQFCALPSAVFSWDRDHRLVWGNLAAARLLGVSTEELHGRDLVSLAAAYPFGWFNESSFAEARRCGRRLEVAAGGAGDRPMRLRIDPLFGCQGEYHGALLLLDAVTDGATPPGGDGAPRALATVIDSVHDGIVVADAGSGAILDVNAGACRLYGLTRAVFLQQDVAVLAAGTDPSGREELAAALARARAGSVETFDCRARDAAGRAFWTEISVRLGDIDGAARLVFSIRDISQRKEAEERLRASEATYRGIIDSVSEAIYVQSADGRIIETNRAAELLCGRSREAMLGQVATNFAAPGRNDLEAVRAAAEAAFGGAPQRFEYWALRGDGMAVAKEVSLTPGLFFGQKVVLAVLRDISARKSQEAEHQRSADALRRSEERFRRLLACIPSVAVQGYGADGTVSYWNEGSERLYGYSAAEATGRNLLDLIIPPPMRDEVRAAVHTMITTGHPIPAAELQLMRKDGQLVPVFSSHAVIDTPGVGVELYCLDIDLTDRKRAEEERLEMQRRLLQAQKLESLGVLAGGIAHDFNNLLTAILGNLGLISSDLPAGSPARASLEDAVHAARSAAGLSRQMLAYSGRSRFIVRDVDIAALLNENAHILRAAVSRNVGFRLETAAPVPLVAADPGQVQQIVMNLVTNASEALGAGSGSVTLRTGVEEADALRLAASRVQDKPEPGTFVFVEVADTGCGMSPETLQRMLDPFFTTKFAGRGLGLPVVLGLVRAHHGALFVASEPGHGTTVRVLFPAKAAEPPPDPAAAAGSADLPRLVPVHGCLLVIDDEEPVRRIFERLGRRFGVEIITAADGQAGLDLFRQRMAEVRCVILDLTMPHMSGLACFDALRALRPEVKVILASGFSVEEVSLRLADSGFAGFLQKPFTVERFIEAVNAAVGGM